MRFYTPVPFVFVLFAILAWVAIATAFWAIIVFAFPVCLMFFLFGSAAQDILRERREKRRREMEAAGAVERREWR